jgi:hypothetical protein
LTSEAREGRATSRRASPEELAWERRFGLPAGLAGLLAAVLFILALYLRAVSLRSSSSDADKVLRVADRHTGGLYASSIAQAIGALLVGIVLLYLYRAARHRRPDLPPVTQWLVIVGALAVAVMSFLAQYEFVQAAKEFVTTKPPHPNLSAIKGSSAYLQAVEALDPKKRAEDISNAHFGGGLQAALFGANFVLGLGVILTSLWARRAGLLARFMGILGIIVGVLYALPFLGGGGGFLQIPWLGAAGLILMDRWPRERGEAWSTGEPVPWLSMAELRAMEQRGAGPPQKRAPERRTEPEPDVEPEAAQAPTRTSRKRKRKQGRKH